jgi:hypothetical protein
VGVHTTVQKVLLVGAHLQTPPAAPTGEPPARLTPLIEAVAPVHDDFDARALLYGDRYRSGFWAIYLLSAFAVLCAVLPLALGWDDARHILHPLVGIWTVCEVLVISAVAAIYWLGHRRDWQGQWLRARTTAELINYLPMLAPLVDFTYPNTDADWYLRVFDPGQNLRETDDVARLCNRIEPLAREQLRGAWSDPGFASAYARWTVSILEGQKRYHRSVAAKQRALLHRVHSLNAWLFGLTALGALAHLAMHSLWLSLVTTFFPALGASLHGALAQSEAYRLSVGSDALANGLQGSIDRINECTAASEPDDDSLRKAIKSALGLILEEHQDWHMLVRPHHLPLG